MVFQRDGQTRSSRSGVMSGGRYGSSFRFVGDYLDTKPLDALGRRKTRKVAIDALDCPTKLQYETSGLVRCMYVSFLPILSKCRRMVI